MIARLSEETQKIINHSANPKILKKLLDDCLLKMKDIGANPDENQIQILTNHLSEMLDRSIKSSSFMEIDKDAFQELSPESLSAASDIVDEVGNLSEDEKFVLAVHFEIAK